MSGNLDEARLLFCDSQSRYRAHEPISELGKDFTYNVRNSNPFMVTKVWSKKNLLGFSFSIVMMNH